VAISLTVRGIDNVIFFLLGADYPFASTYLKQNIPGIIKCTAKISSKIELVIKNVYNF